MILVLLPVRNAANDLSGYIRSVERFADGVLALDDGSTDETLELLRQLPLVKGILHNPRREGFAGWDDAANRNRLLTAAADFSPEWILSLDADERIDEADARALVAFTQTDAVPGLAYGFRCYSTSDDGRWYLPPPIWIYRLFHFSPGQRFSDSRFHFAPIPTDIPREAYLRTSFRIQHLGGFDNARRAARYEKYRDVDPDRRFWPSYSALLAPIDDELLIPWPERAIDDPDLLWDEPAPVAATGHLARAVFVIDDRGREAEVSATLASLSRSTNGSEEILLVGPSADNYAGVVPVKCGPEASRGEHLQTALAATSADLLVVLDAGQTVEASDLSALWGALADGYGVVRCVIRAAGSTELERRVAWLRANWPEEPGELGSWRPVGYRRDALAELGDVPVPTAIDNDVEAYLVRALARKGVLVGRVPATIIDRSGDSAELSIRSGFERGRSWAEIDLLLAGPQPIPAKTRAQRLLRQSRSKNDAVPRSTLAGSAIGYASRLVQGGAGEGWAMLGWPARTIAFVGVRENATPWFEIARIDFVSSSVELVNVPELSSAAVSEQIDVNAAHLLRDQVEFAIGAPIDELVLFSQRSSMGSIADLRRLGSRWDGLRSEVVSTMTGIQLVAVLLRIAMLPEEATRIAPLDPDLPIGLAVIAALKLERATSMRDRLRNVTWA
jgi:hypothetical protein